MPNLRPYQAKLKTDVQLAWAQGARNVLMRLDTGGGKTVILSDLALEHRGGVAVIAHRQELVGQLSLALARNGVTHNIIAAQATKRAIVGLHMAEFGRSYFDPTSRIACASVDTLIRADGLTAWASQVTLWITDEGHHVVEDNKWHRAIELFTHQEVRGLLPTATPSRADGKGLGRHADGVADVMVQGPPMRWLIEQGYLTDYRMVLVESDMQLLASDIGSGGDWSTAKLRDAARGSHIVGDTVANYQRFTPGMRDVTFTPDTETAAEVLAAYQAAGVRAALLTGKTDGGLRRQMLRQFEAGELDELVVVDIVSEGFDMPAIQSAGFARKTNSLATYMQQFGRVLRPMYAKGYDLETQAGRLAAIANGPKPIAIIRDHVGNFLHHGPPDRERPWTLDRRERGARMVGDGIPMRPCLGTDDYPGCYQPFERFYDACPHCGAPIAPPEARGSVKVVEGVMEFLDPDILAAMRGRVAELDAPADAYAMRLTQQRVPPIGVQANYNRRLKHQEAQAVLRAAMAAHAGRRHHHLKRSDREIQREFFHLFGMSVLDAMALPPDDAAALTARIEATP